MRPAHDALLGKPLDAYYADHAAAVEALHGAQGLLNTTVAVVATNARLDKAQATRLAIMADDGLAQAVRPAHSPVDGDSVFVLATGRHDADLQPRPRPADDAGQPWPPTCWVGRSCGACAGRPPWPDCRPSAPSSPAEVSPDTQPARFWRD